MPRNTFPHLPALLGALTLPAIFLLVGCGGDERVVQVAREAADRQAQQNREIAYQNREIAETTKQLVQADGQSRVELVALQRDLQA